MHPQRFLLLGSSETPLFLDDRFEPMPGDAGTFYRIRAKQGGVGRAEAAGDR
jgi:hypothetical protein